MTMTTRTKQTKTMTTRRKTKNLLSSENRTNVDAQHGAVWLLEVTDNFGSHRGSICRLQTSTAARARLVLVSTVTGSMSRSYVSKGSVSEVGEIDVTVGDHP
jgi:hypothetical protein